MDVDIPNYLLVSQGQSRAHYISDAESHLRSTFLCKYSTNMISKQHLLVKIQSGIQLKKKLHV